MRRQFFISLAIFFFLFLGTIAVTLYARGYRFGLGGNNSIVSDTGLLVATSNPNGAQVYINDHLTTATNNTINLAPGDYDIKIYKDGYFPWNKRIKIVKEVVSKADATLFATAPKLESITSTGVINPNVDPSFTRIAYAVSSASGIKKNGIYVFNMNSNSLLTLQSNATQIADDTVNKFSGSLFSWSPDGQNLLASISANTNSPSYYLLDSHNFNQNPNDVTETLDSVNSMWSKEKNDEQKARLSGLTNKLRSLIAEDFNIIAWSDDETKILYTASSSATLDSVIIPPIIGSDSTIESRNLQKGSIYVYDTKEDKNFLINSNGDGLNVSFKLSWMPDGKHLLYVHDRKIQIMDYDGANLTTIYEGPFIDGYVYPWPDGSKLVILTNLNNSDIAPNLYTVSLN